MKRTDSLLPIKVLLKRKICLYYFKEEIRF